MAAEEMRLVVVGAGGFGRETIEIVRALQASGDRITLVGVCDDDPALRGASVLGIPVLGPVTTAAEHDAHIVVTIGHPGDFGIRRRIVELLGFQAERYATLVHPASVVPDSAELGRGTVVHAGVVMTAEIGVGDHVVVMPGVVLTHDDRVGDYATLAAGAMLAGGVTIGEGAYVGGGALIREHLTVGSSSLVGMGSVVTRDVPQGEVWAGVPARKIRTAAGT